MRRLLPVLFLLACEPLPESDPEPPFVCAPPPRLTVFVGEWASAGLCIEDPEGAPLAISLSLTNHAPLAQVEVWGQDSIRVHARWPGTTVVTVTATDPDGLQATMDVPVTVPNRAPVGEPEDVGVPARFGVAVDLSDYYSDPDGQPLIYSASSAAPSIVRVASVSESLLRLEHSGGEGSARISVTASDGEADLTSAFEATVVPPVPVLSDDFDSGESLDDWALDRESRAEIDNGYFVLTADSADYDGRAWQGFLGAANEWVVDITLRTTDEAAQAGFLVFTGVRPVWSYRFLLGEANIPGLEDVNWLFSWWHTAGSWVTPSWAYGTSSHIRDLVDVEVSLSMTETAVRATVDGKLLFEHSGVNLPRRGVGLTLLTRPEGEGDVNSSMNRVRVVTPELTRDSLFRAQRRSGDAGVHLTRRWSPIPRTPSPGRTRFD